MIDTITHSIIDLSCENLSDVDLKNKLLELPNENKLNFIFLGKYSYDPIWLLQKELHDLVKNEKLNSIILFLEHEHVYTFGKNANKDFLLDSYPKNIDVVQTDRGGQVTYHGPGQLIGYPIINLKFFKKSISWYMRSLEEVIIQTLSEYAIISNRKEGMTGVWVDDDKICAMGVRLSKWVTMHGFALNIKPEMQFYDGMIPCGIQEFGITSMHQLLNEDISLYDISNILSNNFNKVFKELD